MNGSGSRLGVGLHVCRGIERTDDGNLAGVDCDQDSYSNLDTLYAAVIGRPPTVHRELIFILNGSIVDKAVDGTSANMLYSYQLDERFVGKFDIIYVEQGCHYWRRSFTMGTCPISHREPIELAKLVNLLHKFRT